MRLISKSAWRLRGWMLAAWIRASGGTCGRNLKCKQWPLFRKGVPSGFSLGDDVVLGYRITIDAVSDAKIILGDRVKLTQDVLLGAEEKIEIGNDTIIAERVSIRDSEHGKMRYVATKDQKSETNPVIIGNDVHIGLGVAVLSGSRIKDGVVIGANSVVTSRVETIEYGIFVGSPSRLVGARK